MTTNRATPRVHLRNVSYVIVLCISIISSGALAINEVLKMSPCPAACNCSQGEGSNRFLALCEGGGAAFEETVRQLPKDVTNFTFVLQKPGVLDNQSLYMAEPSSLINLKTFLVTSTMQGPFKYSPYN